MKWKGYPDATKEALWRITSATKHPDILAAIKRCQDDYNASYPDAQGADETCNTDAAAVIAILAAVRRRDAVVADQAIYDTVGHFAS